MNEPLKKRSGGIPTETYSWVAAAGRGEEAEAGGGGRRRREEAEGGGGGRSSCSERTGKHGLKFFEFY
jgi:hypothetical protein